MIRTITRDERAVGAYWYDENGYKSRLCDRCGNKCTMRDENERTHCDDCLYLFAYEDEAELRALVIAMRDEGMGQRRIGSQLGMSHSTVRRLQRQAVEA